MTLEDIEALELALTDEPDWELNKILPRAAPDLLKLAREALAAREWLAEDSGYEHCAARDAYRAIVEANKLTKWTEMQGIQLEHVMKHLTPEEVTEFLTIKDIAEHGGVTEKEYERHRALLDKVHKAMEK